ncbi:GNAT family N-acetyltransferase [Saccharopolyspora spinosa]|uniref:Acetyltransferase (GNAT) family protein n=1 Tax=Saccharopolyspora spinosa TaxID=60894 RepID=A0A2N3Y2Z3_SACSN|nr:GNAT family N-acetyltransferase [Saccharopolyspora spinosa]PKW17278.1 acetyltransferase (GNAT) family protein [Saccharopolyspora spinosa]
MLQEVLAGEASVLSNETTTVSYAPVTGASHTIQVLAIDGPDALELLRAELAGWSVLTAPSDGEALRRAGARLKRHAMRRDLRSDPPPREWARLLPAQPLRVVACGRPASELLGAWREAFPPDHPDRVPDSDQQVLTELLQPLLTGRVLGPVLACSALVVDAEDRVVAGLVVNDRDGVPWVGYVFRRPATEFAGLGGLLLRRAMSWLSEQGWNEVGLAVTVGNPAQQLYARLGFTITGTKMTLELP